MGEKKELVVSIFACIMLLGLGIYIMLPAYGIYHYNFFGANDSDIGRVFGSAWFSGIFVGASMMLFCVIFTAYRKKGKHELEKTP